MVPPLMPPPASHTLQPLLLWSRPSMRSEIGRRPNSPCQTISVESNRPRLLRSWISPAMGLSVSAQCCSWLPLRSQCASQLGSKLPPPEVFRRRLVHAVHAPGGCRFAADVDRLRSRRLHLKRQLVGIDACRKLAI